MTDRERIVEVLTKAALFFDLDETEKHAVELVERQLAALEAAGFDVYRPDDCAIVESIGPLYASDERNTVYQYSALPKGTYRLVPVGGDS